MVHPDIFVHLVVVLEVVEHERVTEDHLVTGVDYSHGERFIRLAYFEDDSFVPDGIFPDRCIVSLGLMTALLQDYSMGILRRQINRIYNMCFELCISSDICLWIPAQPFSFFSLNKLTLDFCPLLIVVKQ